VHSVRDVPNFLLSWTLYLTIPSTAAMLLRDALTDDRDDDEKRWLDTERILQALGVWDFFGTIPLVRDFVSGARYGTRGMTPLARAAQAGSDFYDSVAKEDKSAREILFDGARVVGIAAGLPAEWLLREGEQELKERE
jgi:hypothetical protein